MRMKIMQIIQMIHLIGLVHAKHNRIKMELGQALVY